MNSSTRRLFPLIVPFAAEIAFSGGTSQGPVSAYLGQLASLLGGHGVADRYLRAALDTAVALGEDARAWLSEADIVCGLRGLRSSGKAIRSSAADRRR